MDNLLEPLRSGNLVILGKRGSGKTTLALAAAAFRPAGLCIDTLGDADCGVPIDYNGLADLRGWSRLNVPGLTAGTAISPETFATAAFFAVRKLAQAGHLPRPFTLLVDEADMYGSAAYNSPALRELARYGRHWGVQYIITARRYAEIPKDWTSGADLILAGPSLDVQDAAFIRRLSAAHVEIWRYLRMPDFLGFSLDGAAIYRYDLIDDSIHARGV